MARGLTALRVERAKPDARKRIEIPDHGKPGLYLIVQSNGKKSWAVRYRRHGDKKTRKYTLPGFPSLAAARKLAQAALDEVAAGGDPAAEKKARMAAALHGSDNVADVFQEFLIKHVRRKDGRPIRESTKRQTAMLLGFRRDPDKPAAWIRTGGGVLTRWQGRAVRSITRQDEPLAKLLRS
jgi:hypothetical protein